MFISEKRQARKLRVKILKVQRLPHMGAVTTRPLSALIMGATMITAAQFVPQIASSAAAQSVSQQLSEPVSVLDFQLRRVSSNEIRAGVQAFKKQDYDLAATYNMRALGLGLSPVRKAAAYSNLCAAYGALEDYPQARQACKAALKLSPDMTQAQHNLALIKRAVGILTLSENLVPADKKS